MSIRLDGGGDTGIESSVRGAMNMCSGRAGALGPAFTRS